MAGSAKRAKHRASDPVSTWTARYWIVAGLSLGGCQSPPPPGPMPPTASVRAPTAPVHFVGGGKSNVSESESSIEDRLGTIQARLETLAVGLMDFWKAHGIDGEYGGVYGSHDRKGTPSTVADKGLVQQSRHLWSFSTWYARREKSPEVKAAADSLYAFIAGHLLDEDGEFFFKVSRDGTRVVDPKKQLYAQSFAIFALSTYADVFGVAEAGEQAMACFRSIDTRAHDADNLGYDQTEDPGFLEAGAQKGTNTHIHLLEAFTALYRQSGDAAVKSRLQEMIKVVSSMIVQPSGYAHKEFYKDWRVHGPAVVSYGHDLETVWLLMDALAALGTPDEPGMGEVAQRLGRPAAEGGVDAERGGYFEEGVPGGAPTRLEKVWWVQAEALAGLWWLHRLSGDASFLGHLERTLSWIEAHQVDAEYGGWYWGLNPDGSMGPKGPIKGEEWMTEYHALRAVVFTSDWIGEALSALPGPRLHGETSSDESAAEGSAAASADKAKRRVVPPDEARPAPAPGGNTPPPL